MKRKVYPLAVEADENEDIVISQDSPNDGSPSRVVITPHQVDFLGDLLRQVVEEIESRREARNEEENERNHGHATPTKERR